MTRTISIVHNEAGITKPEYEVSITLGAEHNITAFFSPDDIIRVLYDLEEYKIQGTSFKDWDQGEETDSIAGHAFMTSEHYLFTSAYDRPLTEYSVVYIASDSSRRPCTVTVKETTTEVSKRIGFTCTGPIGGVHREEYNSDDDWVRVTDKAELEDLFKNCMVPDNFSEYSDEFDIIYDGPCKFLLIDGVPSIQVTYYFNTDNASFDMEQDIMNYEDGSVRSIDDVIEYVVNETRGQLSDGIGEGFEQYPCYETDDFMYFISPGYPDMTVELIK